MNAFTRTLAVLLPVAMLWGCSTTPSPPDIDLTAGDAEMTMTGDGMGDSDMDSEIDSGVEVGGIQGSGGFIGDPLQDPDSMLATRTVYFDFDKSEITSEAREIIEAHAQYLSANPSLRIIVEGHGDERGTREYNLSLGERRGQTVQQVMTLLGVSSTQIEVVSYGEERPAVMGHDENAWAMNRRVEFLY